MIYHSNYLDEVQIDNLCSYIMLKCPTIKLEHLKDENNKLTTFGSLIIIFFLISLIQNYCKMTLKEQPNEQQTNSDSINNHSSNSSNNSDDGPKNQ